MSRCGKIRSESEQECGRQPLNRGDILRKTSPREKMQIASKFRNMSKVKHAFMGNCTEIMTVCKLHIVLHDLIPINYTVVVGL